jgi:glycosyltransferase involved in cell wall biosynthesis
MNLNLIMLSGDTPTEGGIYAEMLRHFAPNWNRIDILTPRRELRGNVFGNVWVHPSDAGKLGHPGFIVRKGCELAAERPYALITSHDYGLFLNGIGGMRLSRAANIPMVSEIHHIEGYPRAASHRERLYRLAARLYIPLAARRVAAFRTVNAGEIPTLLRRWGVPDAKIAVLPSVFVDFDLFRPMPDEGSNEPHDYDALFVGRFAPNKGIFTILDAAAQVIRSVPTFRLGLLGRGALETAIHTRIASLGIGSNIRMVSHVPRADVPRMMNRAGMLVCASFSEGGPRVTVEAMACGVPVISTPVGIMGDLIRDGANGYLFRWDADSLARHMLALHNDPALRNRIGASGRESVQAMRAADVVANYARGLQRIAAKTAG